MEGLMSLEHMLAAVNVLPPLPAAESVIPRQTQWSAPQQPQLITPPFAATGASAAASSGEHPKTRLTVAVSRFVRKTLAKGDILWNAEKLPNGVFRGTVQLVCMNGRQFSAQGTSHKEATSNAATAAFNALQHMLGGEDAGRTKHAGFFGGKKADGSTKAVQNGDFKSALMFAVQKHVRKPLVKGEVAFETIELDGMYQSTVTVHCLGGCSFTGDPSPTQKAAEQSAAKQGLMNGKELMAQAAANLGQGDSGPKTAASGQPDFCPKTELCKTLQQFLKKVLRKGDVEYTHIEADGLIQATAVLHCLEGQQFAGEPLASKKEAERSAAMEVLKSIDPETYGDADEEEPGDAVEAGGEAKSAKKRRVLQ